LFLQSFQKLFLPRAGCNSFTDFEFHIWFVV
jgi:hypothetical protein